MPRQTSIYELVPGNLLLTLLLIFYMYYWTTNSHDQRYVLICSANLLSTLILLFTIANRRIGTTNNRLPTIQLPPPTIQAKVRNPTSFLCPSCIKLYTCRFQGAPGSLALPPGVEIPLGTLTLSFQPMVAIHIRRSRPLL